MLDRLQHLEGLLSQISVQSPEAVELASAAIAADPSALASSLSSGDCERFFLDSPVTGERDAGPSVASRVFPSADSSPPQRDDDSRDADDGSAGDSVTVLHQRPLPSTPSTLSASSLKI